MTKTRMILASAAAALLAAGCSQGAATPTPTSTPSGSTELPMVVTASGYVVYPMSGPDCTQGNLVKKGDPIELLDPAGTVVDTSKLIDALEVKGADGSLECQSSFALNVLYPEAGQYTIKLGEYTTERSRDELPKSILWQLS